RISNCAADLYRSARGLEVVWMRQVIRFDPNWIAGVWPAQTKPATALWSNNSPEKPPSSGRQRIAPEQEQYLALGNFRTYLLFPSAGRNWRGTGTAKGLAAPALEAERL